MPPAIEPRRTCTQPIMTDCVVSPDTKPKLSPVREQSVKSGKQGQNLAIVALALIIWREQFPLVTGQIAWRFAGTCSGRRAV
jgi:hypothetical protein